MQPRSLFVFSLYFYFKSYCLSLQIASVNTYKVEFQLQKLLMPTTSYSSLPCNDQRMPSELSSGIIASYGWSPLSFVRRAQLQRQSYIFSRRRSVQRVPLFPFSLCSGLLSLPIFPVRVVNQRRPQPCQNQMLEKKRSHYCSLMTVCQAMPAICPFESSAFEKEKKEKKNFIIFVQCVRNGNQKSGMIGQREG